jgi:hypothetical protein
MMVMMMMVMGEVMIRLVTKCCKVSVASRYQETLA